MDLATAFVKIRADRSQFDNDLKQVEASATSTGRNIAGVFMQVFSAAAFTAGMKKAVDAASNLNETVSKTAVIYGKDAAAMEKMAETAARTMGMSKRAYLDAASGLKGLLDNMGMASDESTKWSQDLTQLGGDLASFFNTQPADAIYAISAALRGESEPIRRYNVQLSDMAIKQKAVEMGLYSGKGALDLHTKSQAALAVIMEQTTAAQGDFARTSDGLANSQRIAAAVAEDSAASLGQSFLPVYTRVVQVVTFLTEAFGKLPGPVQVAVVALVGLVALSGPISNVATMIGKLGTTTLTTMGALGLLAAAAVVTISLLSSTDKHQGVLAARANEVTSALTNEVAEIIRLGIESGNASGGVDSLAVANGALARALTAPDKEGDKTRAALGALGLQAADVVDVILKLDKNTGQFNKQMVLSSGLFGENAEEVANWITKLDDADELSDQLYATLQRNLTPAEEELVRALENLNDVAEDTDLNQIANQFLNMEIASSKGKESLVLQARAMAAAEGNAGDALTTYQLYVMLLQDMDKEQLAALDSAEGAAEGLEGTGDAAGVAAKKVKDLKEAYDILTGQLDNRDALRNLEASFDDIAKAVGALMDEDSTATLEERQRDYAQAVDDSLRKLLAFSETLGTQIPEEQVTRIKLLIDQGSYDYALALIHALEVGNTSTFEIVPKGSGRGPMQSYDVGGYIDRDQVAMVHGNEVVLPLSSPSRIAALLADPRVSGPVTAAISGGGGGMPATSSGGGVSTPTGGGDTFHPYGWSEAQPAELERLLDARKAGRR